MKYGFYSDNQLTTFEQTPFRCPSWDPMPEGKKNVVILGCSHTYGVGLEPHETWAHHISKHKNNILRFWNISQPGASADTVVRILYSCEKVLHPDIIIVCWPELSRRQRLEDYTQNLMGHHETLRYENAKTDMNNFLMNVFFLEKFAEKNNCKTFHCFADTVIKLPEDGSNGVRLNILDKTSLRSCWPTWNRFEEQTSLIPSPSRARDGLHYGVENHLQFAKVFLKEFGHQLK